MFSYLKIPKTEKHLNWRMQRVVFYIRYFIPTLAVIFESWSWENKMVIGHTVEENMEEM
jgi:hypothetical protein